MGNHHYPHHEIFSLLANTEKNEALEHYLAHLTWPENAALPARR